MKCPECDGTGKVQKWFYERTGFGKCEKVCGDVKCEWCNGTGELEQTEQEYIQTCNTEQLAGWIKGHMNCNFCPMRLKCEDMRDCMEHIKVWLKQTHGE